MAGLFIFDRLGLWMEAKGWVYWRHKKSNSSGSGDALLEFSAMFNPAAKHQLELSQKKDAKERDDQGDDKFKRTLKFKKS